MNRYVQEIAHIGQRMALLGLITARSGNISRRMVGGFMITVSGTHKGSLTKDDVLCMDYQGQPLITQEGMKTPSSETSLHLALYQAYPQIAAIVHAHPPFATALACAGKDLDCRITEEARLFLCPVARLPYYPAGSEELALAAVEAAQEANALLLANHGAVSWGKTLDEALYRMEIMEYAARVMLYTKIFSN